MHWACVIQRKDQNATVKKCTILHPNSIRRQGTSFQHTTFLKGSFMTNIEKLTVDILKSLTILA